MDTNLELALVDQLLRDGIVSFDRAAFLEAHPPEREADDDDDDDEAHFYRRNRAIERALCALLTPAHLRTIQSVLWEGGMPTQHLIWNYWDGEDDAFDIESLAGIEACTALTSISIQYNHAIRDLSPLAQLANLESVRIGSGGRIEDVSPLVGLPRLVRLDLANNGALKDVACLGASQSLEELDLSGCAVEDYAFAASLPRLRKLVVAPSDAAASLTTFAALRERGVTVKEYQRVRVR